MDAVDTALSSANSLSSPPSRASTPGASTRRSLWMGRISSGVAVLFLAFDATMKLLVVKPALEGTARLGWPTDVIFTLGVLQAICLVAYLVPRTAVLGAILWTGYLGGAVATHVRIADPLFSHVLFPVYVAALLWLGLWFRDARLRALVPLRERDVV